jgi:23S rRNA (guanine745-N1)-methyltransferase
VSTENKTQPPTNETIICPVCSQALKRTEKQFCCENNHQFDVAKQGYVNLLQPQYKKSKQPGDSQEMVEARFRFLNEAYYEPLSDKLNQLIAKDLSTKVLSNKEPGNNAYHIVDAGSGEGYYTQRLYDHLNDAKDALGQPVSPKPVTSKPVIPKVIGFDISQRAVKASCRRSRSIQWMTATSSHIPVASHTQDAVLCLFSRIVPEEFSRILKKNGILYVASTGSSHLIELRNMLYQNVKQSAYNPNSTLSERFTPLDESFNENVHYKIEVNSRQAINDLLLMTPHYWRATESAKQVIQAMDTVSVTVDIRLTG